jgi:hypothetical protein
MFLKNLTESLSFIICRLALYMTNNVIDDPAMLALVFC